MKIRSLGIAAFAATLAAGAAGAQTIYPIDRAEILKGAKFDLKVEFPAVVDPAKVKVTINGQDHAAVLGRAATFIEKEDGKDVSSLVLRDVTMTKPGMYVVQATDGTNTKSVGWEVYGTAQKPVAKNVILFIGDGLSVGHRTIARILSKGIKEGKYGGELAIDDMPHMALISTAGTDSVITDSANSISAYTTGHKSCVNALGVYCSRAANSLEHPKVETFATIAQRVSKKAVGVVTNTEIEDATPAGMVSHTRRRSDYDDIVQMFYDVKPDVIMGGGSLNFIPKSTTGSRRKDDQDFVQKFQDAGYTFVQTNAELKAKSAGANRLLGLFNTSNIDGALDRRILKKGTVDKFPDQPDLTDQVKAALGILEKKPNGFVMLVESGRIDKYAHSMDWERSAFETIMLDNAVKLAKDWAGKRNDTLIIVVGDHAHSISLYGGIDDSRPGTEMRDKVGTYQDAGFPNYPPADKDGYPTSVDVSRRLAVTFGNHPDYYATYKPYLDGENVPAVVNQDKKAVANEKYKEGAVLIPGNLPRTDTQAVHSGDDEILTAMGPGSERFHGHMANVEVFRVIANALALGR